MCGLVGVMGNLYKKDLDSFNQMLLVDTLRGDHSTGIAAINGSGDANVFKMVGPAWDLLDRKSYDKVATMTARVLIGHNRFGTMGARNSSNAHPFDFKNVVGAHNGTVDYQSKMRMLDGGKFDTDSEAIYNNIDQWGVEATIPLLEGAWALVWVDKVAKTLNMIRNAERPLHIAYNKARTVMYWASELGMLKWILERNGVDVEDYYYIPENTLYSWKISKGNEVIQGPEVTKGIVGKPRFQGGYESFWSRNRNQQLIEHKPQTTSFTAAKEEARATDKETLKEILKDLSETEDDAPWEDDDDTAFWVWKDGETYEEYAERTAGIFTKSRGVTTTDEKKTTQPTEDDNNNVVSMFQYKHPNTRQSLSKVEFEEISQYGCDCCGNDINWGDQCRIVQVTDSPEIFCINCVVNDKFTKDYIRG